jgi:hypothetical protein
MGFKEMLGGFMVALGFQVDDDGIDKFQKKSEDLRNSALRLGAVFTGAAIGVGLFVEKVASGMGEIWNFAELNQVSARSIEAWSRAGIDFDVTAESMRGSMASLNKKIGEAATGIGRGKMIFEKLGLSAKDASGHVRTTDEMLEVLAGKMQHLSRAENLAIAGRLGLDPQMVLMLEQGYDKVHKLREEADLLNPLEEKDYERADQIDKLFLKAKATVGLLSKMIAVQLFPAVHKVLTAYLEWFNQVRKSEQFKYIFSIISATIETLTDWLLMAVSSMRRAWDWLTRLHGVATLLVGAIGVLVAYQLASWFMVAAEAVWGAVKAVLALDAAAAALAWEVVLVGALIVGIGLLVDDIWNWYQGNDSLFGDLTKRFPWLLNIARVIEKVFRLVAAAFMYAWSQLKEPVIELGKSVWDLIKVLSPVLLPLLKVVFGAATLQMLVTLLTQLQALVVAVTFLAKAFGAVAKAIKLVIDLTTTAIEKISSLVGWVKRVPGVSSFMDNFKAGMGVLAGNFQAGMGTLATPVGTPMFGPGGILGRAETSVSSSHTTSSTTRTSIHAPITIYSTDPDRSGAAVKQELNQTARESIRNGQSAVVL